MYCKLCISTSGCSLTQVWSINEIQQVYLHYTNLNLGVSHPVPAEAHKIQCKRPLLRCLAFRLTMYMHMDVHQYYVYYVQLTFGDTCDDPVAVGLLDSTPLSTTFNTTPVSERGGSWSMHFLSTVDGMSSSNLPACRTRSFPVITISLMLGYKTALILHVCTCIYTCVRVFTQTNIMWIYMYMYMYMYVRAG